MQVSLSPDHTDPTVTDPDSLISTVPGANEDGTITTSAHRTYSFAAATWLSLLATPLLFFPRILSLIFGSLLTVSGDPDGEGKAEVIRQLNVLERSLAGLTGLACLSLAMILIVQSGVLPLTSSFASPTGSSPTALLADAPYRTPTVLVATFFFFSLAWYSYDLGMWVVTGVSGGMVIWGAWAILFASETRVNKAGKKAMDGAMSSFPFKNAHAEEAKKML